MEINQESLSKSQRKSCNYSYSYLKYLHKLNETQNHYAKDFHSQIPRQLPRCQQSKSSNDVLHLSYHKSKDNLIVPDSFESLKCLRSLKFSKTKQRFDRKGIPIKKTKPIYHHITFADCLLSPEIPMVDKVEVKSYKKYNLGSTIVQNKGKPKCCCCKIY